MDAPEADFDIKLQKISSDLIADLDHALTTAFRKPDGHGGTQVRFLVKAKETFRSTTTILDMFQELPQLLDSHLPKWIPLLAGSYLEYMQTQHRLKRKTQSPGFLVPVDYAICKVLYAFCKVRGEKVIVRFLNVETRYLEVLLSAIEDAEEKSQVADAQTSSWEWEQRYVVLLWLSHLLLAPFDLSTISTLDIEESGISDIPGLQWPDNLPGITLRVVPLAIKYLSSPGKEKDAAKALLVRVAMRRDMQKLGVLDALVRWAMASFRSKKDEPLASPYLYLGVLSFLAGVLRSSAETSDMNEYLVSIFQCVYDLSLGANELSRSIVKLAVARKLILKVIRSVVVSLLRQPQRSMANTEITETAIGHLLDSVSDNDTPVRLSASKALSIIALKLDPGMASQVVEAVLGSLNRNVLWTTASGGKEGMPVRNLSAVNHLEWHGLVLTLSHLLYRRSPPAEQLSDIIHALLLGLSFEQRSTSGGSVGSNVRDAACFGIWALARRYTTKELLSVPIASVFAAKSHPPSSSILQVLATELVVTASLDPAGNIRRGASAALQELIGRHPDTVEKGIDVVQIVDYHAVARRSRAIEEVAVNATRLSSQYGEAIVDGMLGWRGIGDMDAQSRRVAGSAFGVLIAEMSRLDSEYSLQRFRTSSETIMSRTPALAKRQVEERHGLLLCFASVLDNLTNHAATVQGGLGADPSLATAVLESVSGILEECCATEYRKPFLIAEGASRLTISSLPVLQAAISLDLCGRSLEPGHTVLSLPDLHNYNISVTASVAAAGSIALAQIEKLITALRKIIPAWLSHNEAETVEQASAAALLLVIFSKAHDKNTLAQEWASVVGTKPTSRSVNTGQGYFHALAMAQPIFAHELHDHTVQDVASQALLDRWAKDDDTNVRVTILQCLVRCRLLQTHAKTFLAMLVDGLNDYTTTARGDVGSHVRVQALRAVRSLWENSANLEAMKDSVQVLLPHCLRLAAEKLDRVRPEAQVAVALTLRDGDAHTFRSLTFSSKPYFDTLLRLAVSDNLSPIVIESTTTEERTTWMAHLMTGFVTSADTGNDDLVVSSRAALTEFCETSQEHDELVCVALTNNLRMHFSNDRVSVSTLEMIAFLFHVDLFRIGRGSFTLRSLCLYTQKAGYKSGNMRKLMACIKVYGGVATLDKVDDAVADGVGEARKRLGALMFHPWPRVRSAVVDEIWGLLGGEEPISESDDGQLTGVDWSAADKAQIRATVQALGMD